MLQEHSDLAHRACVIFASLVGQVVKTLPASPECRRFRGHRQVQSLCQEDPLEKEMATHSSILAWEIPWIKELGRLQSMESQKSQTQLNGLPLWLSW